MTNYVLSYLKSNIVSFYPNRTSFETLNDSVKKLNSEVGLQNNNMKEELSRLNERISFVDVSLGKSFDSDDIILEREKKNVAV